MNEKVVDAAETTTGDSTVPNDSGNNPPQLLVSLQGDGTFSSWVKLRSTDSRTYGCQEVSLSMHLRRNEKSSTRGDPVFSSSNSMRNLNSIVVRDFDELAYRGTMAAYVRSGQESSAREDSTNSCDGMRNLNCIVEE